PAPDPVGFLASLKRIFLPHVLSRVIVMAMLFGLQRLNAMLLPLIITHSAGGTVVDFVFVSGLTASARAGRGGRRNWRWGCLLSGR
ncbi:hypothetical protein ACC690_38165, partial [Rhizobium johnstonii]